MAGPGQAGPPGRSESQSVISPPMINVNIRVEGKGSIFANLGSTYIDDIVCRVEVIQIDKDTENNDW